MTVKSLRDKILVILILFTLLFTNCGFTIQAIATSDEFRVIAKGLFQKDEMKFKAYFVDSEGNETSEIICDVNKPANLVLEITPQVEGVLKSGLIRLVPFEEGELNFRLTGSAEDQVEKLKNALKAPTEKEEATEETTEESSEEIVQEVLEEQEILEETEELENTVTENIVTEETSNTVLEELGTSLKSLLTPNKTDENETDDDDTTNSLKSALTKTETPEEENEEVVEETEETEVPEVEEVQEEVEETEETEEVQEPEEIQEEFVDEEALAEAKLQEAKLREELENAISDIEVISDNEIQLSYLKDKTIVELEIEYVQGEKLSVKDLMQKFKLQFSGSFINEELEEIEIGKEEELTIGWKYSKDFVLSSEYSKVSPFEIGEVKGTIVENKVAVSRKEENKFLPVKSLNLEIEVPTLEGDKPTNVEVNASKLMATRGEDIGLVNFNSENWTYDEESGKIIITVNNLDENGYAINSVGEDEFVVIYRYEKYIEEEPDLLKRVKATLEEYSSPENNVLTKEINNKQDIKVDVGEIVTYSVTTTDDKINKAKIYANYNSEEAVYETEFKTQVSVNILTSDILETLKIDCSKDIYKDIENTIFEANDVRIKQIKFNYSEIISLLDKGGDITIMNKNNEILNILTRELITNEEDVVLNLNNSDGLIVAVNNINSDGIINFEVTKVILKPTYDKSAYKNFVEIESTVAAEIKYTELEETTKLEETKTTKKFEEAMTIANIVLNRDSLSTISPNEDVEIKIELNNDKEYSDLYQNPSFEIVFPKYVKEVSVQSVNMLYEEGLRVADFKTFKDDELVKIKLDLAGTQTRFVESDLTNGTNIILNLNIDVDDYTPAKEDQIKLYYCNEGVTSYQTQTKWSLEKGIPNGILKTSNGFDVAVINYQAPSGLVTANGIVNYDGNLSSVTSVRQGEEKRMLNRNEPSRIATMELLALNNTGNECTEVFFLGRVPFNGNKDVVSNEDIGTNIDTVMLDKVKENIENKNLTKIYYSTNADATTALSDSANGWTEEPENITEVKSFLIEVKGTMEPGTALLFTYDFKIPENLLYDSYIAGSFGAFYNNHTDVAIVYESSSADKVSLYTESGPRIEAKLEVDAGEGTVVKGYQILKYTVTVVNTGSVAAENIIVNSQIPDNAAYGETSSNHGNFNYGFMTDYNKEEILETIERLEPGEAKEVSYYVEAYNPSNETIEKNIKCQAIVRSSLSTEIIKTNEVTNRIKKAAFKMEMTDSLSSDVTYGTEDIINLKLKNEKGTEINNVVAILNLGNILSYEKVIVNEEEKKVEYDEETGKVYIDLNTVNTNEEINIEAYLKGKNTNNISEEGQVYFEIQGDDIETEYSFKADKRLIRSLLTANDISKEIPKEINEEDDFTITTEVENIGTYYTDEAYYECNLPDDVKIKAFRFISPSMNIPLNNGGRKDVIYVHIPNMAPGEKGTIELTLKTVNKAGSDSRDIFLDQIIHNKYQEDIKVNRKGITILNDKLTVQEKVKEYNTADVPKDETVNIADNILTTDLGTIRGNVWFDLNKNGQIDEDDRIGGVKVYLSTADNTMQQSTMSDSNGEYEFSGLIDGEYIVGFEYDQDKYQLTTYKKNGIEETENSDAIDVNSEMMSAVSNKVYIGSESKVENINVGLQEKDVFDLSINKYISNVTVTTPEKTKDYEFDNLEFAKVEINPNDIGSAKVDLDYLVIVKNTGNVEGYAEQIVDYMDEGVEFDQSKNEDWYLGTDGYLYTKNLGSNLLQPGETKELKLTLSKTMSSETTGVVQGKANLKGAFTTYSIPEERSQNVGVQNTFIVLSKGHAKTIIFITIGIAIVVGAVLTFKEKLLNLDIHFFKKKVYKNDKKEKHKMKKIYK